MWPTQRTDVTPTAATAADTDDDGLTDAHEVYGTETDPNAADTDGDGLVDGAEVHEYRTDPLDADTDGDGLADGNEVNAFGTDPLDADSDGDGVSDTSEVDGGSLARWLTNHETVVGLAGALVAVFALGWTSRRRWLPVVPARARTVARENRAVRRLRSAFPAERAGVAVSTLSGVWRRARSATAAARAAAAEPGSTANTSAEADGGHSVGDTPAGEESPAARDPDGAAGAGAAGGHGTAGETGSGADRAAATADPTEASRGRVLTPEEEVQAVLAANGGRLKQTEIVDRTGWSKSKVSRTLSRMDDDGTVEKTSIGWGNVISLPDHTPDGAHSPFDDDDR